MLRQSVLVIVLAGFSFPSVQVSSVLAACCPQTIQKEKPDDVLTRAKQIYTEQGPRPALPEFERALALYREAGDRKGEAITLGLVGNCHKRFGDFQKALDYLSRALALKRELGERLEEGKTLSHLGLVYWEMGEYPAAIEHLTRSIAIGRELKDRTLEGSALNNLSLVYDELGDYRKSLEQYHRVLELYRGANFERGESDTLGNIGGVYLLLGQYREALLYYQQSLAISGRLNLKTSASQDLGNLALCYLGLGQIQQSLDHFDRALQLAKEAGLKKEAADWRKGKGSALVRWGKYAAAFEEYELALSSYEEAGLKRELVEALNDKGILHARLGDAASAEKSFRRAIELARAMPYPRGVTLNLIALGDLEWRRKRLEEAGALYRDALSGAKEADDQASQATIRIALTFAYRDQGRLQDAEAESLQALELARKIGARPLEVEALYAQAEVSRAKRLFEDALRNYDAANETLRTVADPELAWRVEFGRGQVLEALDRNEEALGAYRRAVSIIEHIRSELREERFRASFLEDKYQVYVALVQLLLKLGQPEEAFRYAEQLRARSYLDQLNRGAPPIHDEMQRQAEAALRERMRQLQRVITQENAKPPREQRRQVLELFSGELGEAERAYQTLLDDLHSTEPAYVAVRTLEVPSSDDVGRSLPSDTALIEYVVAEDSVAIFVVTAEGIQAKNVRVRSIDLYAKVELLRDLIVREGSRDWRAPAESLHRSLVAPLEEAGWLKGILRLYIVPHGILHYVPFAALPRSQEKGGRFLADDYVVAYLPAAAVLIYQSNPRGPAKSAFALAPAKSNLQYSLQEARNVTQLFPQNRLLLAGSQAKESALKKVAGNYDILHFATHGYFNKLNPLFSGVELETDASDDGRLEVHEILGLRLNAHLVTLSACDTALGGGYFTEVPAGDDLVGLTRAFLLAGSSSVLASLWAVNDRSTMALMRSFYAQWPKTDKATALTLAQRQMRRSGGRYTHPYFWAAFVLVGQME